MPQSTPAPRPPIKTGSQRQTEYTARMRAKGYSMLLGLWVPNAIKDECRELVKVRVAQYEEGLSF